ncbi:MAG TPA: cytochrome P450 [Solirubrobacteraceae bacterium]|nr:cytochrome P450 [Solirubrobacteraceae bacterium]
MLERAAQRCKLGVVQALEAIPAAPRPLAPPPAGSGLRPVPGDPGPPLIGYSLSLLTDVLRHARRRYERYGPVSWSGGVDRPAVSILGPDAIEEVLADRDRAISNRSGWGYMIGPFFTGAVMLMDGDEHRRHRRIMHEAFRHERLAAYLRALYPTIERGLHRWGSSERFRAYDAVKQLTLDIGTEVFVGASLGADADRVNRAFVDAVHGGKAVIRTDAGFGAWHRGLIGRRLLEDHFRALLPGRRGGGGEDKCIGLHFGSMEVKALMHRLLLRFQWSVPPGYEPSLGYGTGPNPSDGLPVMLRAAGR